MFNNVASKLKFFSKVLAWLGIIIGITMIIIGFSQLEFLGWTLIIQGFIIGLFLYVMALMIYAFAGLVEDVAEIRMNSIKKE